MHRILIIPSFYMKNVLGCAGVRIMWSIGRGLVQRGHVVYMVFPKTIGDGGKKYASPDWEVTAEPFLSSLPNGRAKDVWVDMPVYKFDSCVVPSMVKLLQPIQCSFVYDVILDFSRTRSLIYRRLMAEAYGVGPYDVWTPIVNIIDDIVVHGKSHFKTEDITLMNVIGAIGDWACYTTEREKTLFRQEASKVVAPTVLRKMLDRGTVIGIPADLKRASEILQWRKQQTWNKDFVTVMYGGQFSAKKHVPDMLEQVEKLYRAGFPIRMKLTTMGKPDERTQEWETKYKDFLTVYYSVQTEEFIEHLKDADVFLCFSDDEGAGLSFVEMLASGLVGIYRDKPWLAGRMDGYPWKAAKIEECGTILGAVVKSFKSVREKFFEGRFADVEIERFDFQRVAKSVETVIDTVMKEQPKIETGWVRELAIKAELHKRDTFTLDEACETLKNTSDTGMEFGIGKMVHGFYVRKVLIDMGFHDTGDTDSVVFTRGVSQSDH